MTLSEAWQYKGQLLEEQGRYEEAVQALENATRVNPENQRDWRELGNVLVKARFIPREKVPKRSFLRS